MSRILLLIFGLLLLASPSRAQTPLQEAILDFDEGTVHLLEGNFSDALSLYSKAEASDWASPELFYNMALANLRMNRLGQAVLYLERARQLSPEDPKILHSLGVANHRQADRFSQLPTPFLKKIHQSILRMLPVRSSFWLGFLFAVAFSALLAGKLVWGVRGDWWRRSRLVSGIAAIVLLVFALGTSAWPPFEHRAVVLAPEVRMRAEAIDTSEEILRIHEGLVVKIESETMDWAHIELSNGTDGWVARSVLESI